MSTHAALNDILAGAYDTHIHCAPDTVPRIMDFVDVSRAAVERRMAGIIFKDVGSSTVDRAFAMSKSFPGLKVAGGVVLDRTVGGLNPVAVDQCLRSGGRIIWMPVVDSRQSVELSLQGKSKGLIKQRTRLEDALTVIDEDGHIVGAVKEIVALIRDHGAVLATGHLSPMESLKLVQYARREGIERVVVTHPCAAAVDASLELQHQYAQAGALLEHCYSSCTPGLDDIPVSVIAQAIRSIGAEHCIISSDLGQTFNPPPADGMQRFAEMLHAAGVTQEELRRMLVDNPATLFA